MITLNLLPPTQRAEIKKERIFSVIESSLCIFLIILIFIALVLFFARKTLENNLKELSSQDIKTTSEISILNEKIQEINETLEVADEIQKKTKNTSPFILEFSKTIPQGVLINSFQINTKDNSVNIKGWAKTRSDLLKFKENLEKSDKFDQVQIPLSNLLEKENIEFDFSCFFRESVANPIANNRE